jgi:hypothetical protein
VPVPNTIKGRRSRTAAEPSGLLVVPAKGSVSLGGIVSPGRWDRGVLFGRDVVGGVAVVPATPPVGVGRGVSDAGALGVPVGATVGVGVGGTDDAVGDGEPPDGTTADPDGGTLGVMGTDADAVRAEAVGAPEDGWTAVLPDPFGADERGPPGSPNTPAASANVARARFRTPSATMSRAR